MSAPTKLPTKTRFNCRDKIYIVALLLVSHFIADINFRSLLLHVFFSWWKFLIYVKWFSFGFGCKIYAKYSLIFKIKPGQSLFANVDVGHIAMRLLWNRFKTTMKSALADDTSCLPIFNKYYNSWSVHRTTIQNENKNEIGINEWIKILSFSAMVKMKCSVNIMIIRIAIEAGNFRCLLLQNTWKQKFIANIER